ncbi:hypothetical protein [Desulfobacula sp.]|uniref:hypothetical protein n=1 Tax=Desulfobacula sp. TaxID=2593537 RepID=UPI0025C5C646|nr:hypothetical protein [Desulfobacula sp.]MBC2702953.1 hypothetical protein [Desulfobacula sp.]
MKPCYLCRTIAKIVERPDGYDGNFVKCPECTEYKITRNAIRKILNTGPPYSSESLVKKIKRIFKETKRKHEVTTIELELHKTG